MTQMIEFIKPKYQINYLTIKEIIGDGNFFYRAFSYYMHMTEQYYKEY